MFFSSIKVQACLKLIIYHWKKVFNLYNLVLIVLVYYFVSGIKWLIYFLHNINVLQEDCTNTLFAHRFRPMRGITLFMMVINVLYMLYDWIYSILNWSNKATGRDARLRPCSLPTEPCNLTTYLHNRYTRSTGLYYSGARRAVIVCKQYLLFLTRLGWVLKALWFYYTYADDGGGGGESSKKIWICFWVS